MLSYYAGLRIGEIASLKVGDIYDEMGNVKDQIRLKAANTKANEARTIFINNRLNKEAQIYLGAMGELPDLGEPLLITQKGGEFSANTLCQLFGELYAKAGIDGASSHSGRRWFITRLAHSGVSAKVIMTLAGHKHLSTTQRYIDVNDEMLKAAVEIL
jgi:integrase/recombinase XerD